MVHGNEPADLLFFIEREILFYFYNFVNLKKKRAITIYIYNIYYILWANNTM